MIRHNKLLYAAMVMRSVIILTISIATGMFACEAREDVQSEAREESLEEFQESQPSAPCRLSGQWDVEETVSGGTCGEERLTTLPLRITIEDQEDQGVVLEISVTRGEESFVGCAGTRALEGCAVDVTCSPMAAGDRNASLELEIEDDGRLIGREILTYRDGVDSCNVEFDLAGSRVSESTSE